MKKILLMILVSINIFASDIVKILPYKTYEFSPSLKQKFTIEFDLKESANVKIDIYTPDNNLLITLGNKEFKKGKHSLVWDGKDANKIVVPDEAYNIVLTAKSKTAIQVIDPRLSGGEIIKDLNTKVDKKGNISYFLKYPARVLVRAGIENGPMLRVISNWIPKNKGKVRQKWNMKDSDNIIDISKLKFAVSVSAFKLPEYAIITTNNNKIDYFSYFKQNSFTCHEFSEDKQILVRGDKGISKHFYTCRIKDRDPRLFLEMINVKKDKNNIPLLDKTKPTIVKVFMDPEDEALFEKTKYEVSFFIDQEFTSEEELGYMPISWSFNPYAIRKGRHTLTVNVSSFNGQVGVKSCNFSIK